MLDGLVGAARAFGSIPFRLPFVLLWAAGFGWLLFNAKTVYGDAAEDWRWILVLYAVFLNTIFVQTGIHNPLTAISIGQFLLRFAYWFVIGVVLFKALAPFNPEQAILATEAIGIGITHAFVIAIGEEIAFRYGIPSILSAYGIPPMAAQAFSAALFGVYHYAVYGGAIGTILFVGVLGLAFGAITVLYKRDGLLVAMAWHAAWNLSVLGITP